jgi:peptidoglycan hydrolase FlgJ
MQIAHVSNASTYPLSPARTARPPIDKHSGLYKACLDFESLFIRQMLEVMRKSVHREGDLLGGGMTRDVFESMLYDEYAKKMAQTAGFGLAETIYRQVSSK